MRFFCCVVVVHRWSSHTQRHYYQRGSADSISILWFLCHFKLYVANFCRSRHFHWSQLCCMHCCRTAGHRIVRVDRFDWATWTQGKLISQNSNQFILFVLINYIQPLDSCRFWFLHPPLVAVYFFFCWAVMITSKPHWKWMYRHMDGCPCSVYRESVLFRH